MHPLINIALAAARDSAAALAHKAERLDRVRVLDSKPGSFTTSADLESDETLRYHIQKTHPTHNINSRVSGLHNGDNSEPVWLIDPLVGSQNFASGYSRFGVAIAIQRGGVIEHSVIVMPMQSDELFASRGKGAQLNSRRVRASGDELKGSLIGLDNTEIVTRQFIGFQTSLLNEGAQVRLGGHGALDIADVACGKLQGGWCQQHSEHSLAAANLILLEAGGLIGTEEGNPRLETGNEQLFAPPKVFKQLLRLRSRLDF